MPHQRKGGIHESTEYSWETFGWYRLTGLLSLKYLSAKSAKKSRYMRGFLLIAIRTSNQFSGYETVGRIFLLLLTGLVQAQKQGADFGAIDWQVQSVKGGTPDTLAYNLTAPYATDMEKVRAIYSWICGNIAYNANIYKPHSLRPRFVQEPVDTTREWKPADEMVAQKVLKRGLAVCEGYAKLFKVLCHYAGIEAVILHGYVRTDYDRATERFRTNHTWNAVRIDSAWHLLDVTWAAGFMNYRDEFVQQQNDFYFLTPPEVLIRDHYPEDLRWTLLAQPPTVSEFKKMPFKSKCFIKYGITAYFPSQGLLEALPGDTLSFQIDLLM
jgi:hypothetical protein